MLLEGSYSDFNIRNLAKNCGMGLGTLYNYFENKEVLVFHIFKSDWEKTLQLVDKIKPANIPLKEKIHKVFSSLETFISQYMCIFQELSDGGRKGIPHNYYMEIYLKMKELLDEEQKAGNIHNDIGTDKMSYFIMSNIFNVIKNKHLTFNEMYECIRI